MNHRQTIRIVVPLSAACLALTSCETVDPMDRGGSVFGPEKGGATIYVASADGPVKVGNLVKVAKTIRKYKNLNASEAQILQALAQQKFDGMVVREMKILEKKYEAKKKVVRAKTKKRVDEVRRKATVKRKAAAAAPPEKRKAIVAEIEKEVVEQIAAVEREEVQQVKQIETEHRIEAINVAKAKVSGIAVPVKNPEGKQVIAVHEKISSQGVVSVAKAAYEVDVNPAMIAKSVQGTSVAIVDNKTLAVVTEL